ncbi:DUF397 domain-containing protein [Streptomyces halstedii]|uniref:DUF397 domain-containing protein n=1 Tax=Streptomyces halstedii TaxID=1944 RepID=UPI003864174E
MTERTVPHSSSLNGWRKSSYSNSESGSCVEVIDHHPTAVPVRADPPGPRRQLDVLRLRSQGGPARPLSDGAARRRARPRLTTPWGR